MRLLDEAVVCPEPVSKCGLQLRRHRFAAAVVTRLRRTVAELFDDEATAIPELPVLDYGAIDRCRSSDVVSLGSATRAREQQRHREQRRHDRDAAPHGSLPGLPMTQPPTGKPNVHTGSTI